MDVYQERIRPLFDGSSETNAEIERKLGIPPKTINKWNTTPLKSWRNYIHQIASYFHVSTDYLLGNTDDPRPIGESHDISSFPSLNGEVGELVDIFNSLTKDGKTMLLGVARSLLSNPAYSLNRVEEKMAE